MQKKQHNRFVIFMTPSASLTGYTNIIKTKAKKETSHDTMKVLGK
jgi:hypothetical protein